MATLEDEIKDLKEQNNELVQKVQYWKMTAAEKENDRIALMKENNELRLKLSRLRNSGGLQARNLDTALQAASEKALSHLVMASAEIAKSMDIAKAYIRDRQELDAQSPRWSTLSGTPNSEKKDRVHRVPPTMMGGQPLQPVVALSRTLLNTSNPIALSRSPNRSISERAVPMHMLQEVYIPLTRIDVSELQNNNLETGMDNNIPEDSIEELGLDDSGERMEEAQRMSDDEEFQERRLHAVTEDLEPEDEVETPPRMRSENPLEGPSWLLDTPATSETSIPKNRTNLEPDSTTELELNARRTLGIVADHRNNDDTQGKVLRRASVEFSPTVRRRKRTSSPPPLATPTHPHRHYSPRPHSAGRNSNGGRVLKVLVAKMRLDGEDSAAGDVSPPKRGREPQAPVSPAPQSRDAGITLVPFDAPSPNGATDSAVIVSDKEQIPERVARNVTRRESHHSRTYDESASEGPFDYQNSSRGRCDLPSTSRSRRTPSVESRTRSDARRVPTLDDRGLSSFDGRQDRVGSCDGRHGSRVDSHDSRDSDSGSGGGGDWVNEGRTRRNRKLITYKEKPLNRKLRR